MSKPAPMIEKQNPVLVAELAHLRRVDVGKSRRWLTILFAGSLALSLILAGCLSLLTMSTGAPNPNLYQTYQTVSGLLQNVNSVLLVLAFMEHLLLVSQALLMSTSAIVREKEGRTWEALILTTIDARQIVNGKWIAILQHLYRQHWKGILVRAAAVFWIALQGARGGIIYNVPDIFAVALCPVLIVAYSFANMGLTSALGLLSSFTGRTIGTVFRFGMLLNLMVILLGFWLAVIVGVANTSPYFLWGAVMLVAATPVDGGLMLSYGLVTNPLDLRLMNSGMLVFAALAIYGAVIWLALRLARAMAVRQNALGVQTRETKI